eukprot:scaffold8286_cov35-Tisochrysis_lutea.AAC.2
MMCEYLRRARGSASTSQANIGRTFGRNREVSGSAHPVRVMATFRAIAMLRSRIVASHCFARAVARSAPVRGRPPMARPSESSSLMRAHAPRHSPESAHAAIAEPVLEGGAAATAAAAVGARRACLVRSCAGLRACGLGVGAWTAHATTASASARCVPLSARQSSSARRPMAELS